MIRPAGGAVIMGVVVSPSRTLGELEMPHNCIWDYIGDGFYKCRICGKIVKETVGDEIERWYYL